MNLCHNFFRSNGIICRISLIIKNLGLSFLIGVCYNYMSEAMCVCHRNEKMTTPDHTGLMEGIFMENQKQNRKVVPQDWNPPAAVQVLYKIWRVLFAVTKVAAGALATVLLIISWINVLPMP